MEKLKLENWECSIVLPSYEDLVGKHYEPNNIFRGIIRPKMYRMVFDKDGINIEFTCCYTRSVPKEEGIDVAMPFVTIESDFNGYYDAPFNKENYEEAIQTLKDILSKKESK